MYSFAIIAVNMVLGFIGYWVNAFALISISGDSGGYWGGGSPSEIIWGIITLLLSSAFAISINWCIYRRYCDGKLLSKKFLLPMGIWFFAAILVPIWHIFIW